METISVSAKVPISLTAIEEIVSRFWRVEYSHKTLVVYGTGSRAYLHAEPGGEAQFHLLMDYSDVELAKAVLALFANDHALVVDNDFGTVLPGDEFVARIRADQNWNWRHDI